MKSEKPKVMHPILGQPIIYYPLKASLPLSKATIVVIGHGKENVSAYLDQFKVLTAVQEPQLGTGHAILQTLNILKSKNADEVLILPGDMPLITRESLQGLLDTYTHSKSPMGILTAELQNPFGYGRIVRDAKRFVTRIVEELDTSPRQKKIKEINTGVYIINKDFLLKSIPKLSNKNKKGEFYLTDIVAMAKKSASFKVNDPDEAYGINSKAQLAHAARVMQQRINQRHMEQGVTIIAPESTWISPEVAIASDTEIWPDVHILGKVSIEKNVTIMPGAWIKDSTVETNTIIGNGSIVEDSHIPHDSKLAPFSHIREYNPF
jgi:bifunctional UDP-N-acetylglucosamine pyrophosphorylase/glucosamine-1-phosphate N-acetyltransferase